MNFCPATARYLQVSRPVNGHGDGVVSLLSDRGNPRWRSAPSIGVGMTVGNLVPNHRGHKQHREESHR